jgi:hypothetical protein
MLHDGDAPPTMLFDPGFTTASVALIGPEQVHLRKALIHPFQEQRNRCPILQRRRMDARL